jgi:F-type H+-transporting ATPase subunit b
MKPGARKGLLAISVLYVITVAVMVVNFTLQAEPKYREQLTRDIRTGLNGVRARAHAADPEHIRATDVTEREADELVPLLSRKGSIININYTLVLQCLNFIVLLLLLYGFAWDPLLAFIDERRRRVKSNLDEAERSRRQGQELAALRMKELEQFRSERHSVMEKATEAAERQSDAIIRSAREEAERIGRQAHERIAEETRRARAALREEIAEITAGIAEKVLRREMTRDDHRRFVERMASQLAQENGAGGRPEGEGE